MPSHVLQHFKTYVSMQFLFHMVELNRMCFSLTRPLFHNVVNAKQVTYPQHPQYAKINAAQQSTTTKSRKFEGNFCSIISTTILHC